jgi:hypothetical protein
VECDLRGLPPVRDDGQWMAGGRPGAAVERQAPTGVHSAPLPPGPR